MEVRLWPANSGKNGCIVKCSLKGPTLESFCFGTIYLRQALSIIPSEQKETLKLNKLVL